MKNGSYLSFDPVTMMAIPANSNAQRLGIGAPVIDIVRKVIQIERQLPRPTPKKTAHNHNNRLRKLHLPKHLPRVLRVSIDEFNKKKDDLNF